jgi:hypothetical protein
VRRFVVGGDRSPVTVATALLGWTAAVLALVCCGLALAAVHKGREVRSGSAAIVADIRASNESFTPVDLSAVGQVRAQLDDLTALLGRLRASTGANVDLLLAMRGEVAGLTALTDDDLGITRALAAAASGLSAKAAALADVAGASNAETGNVVKLLRRVNELGRAINTELAALERKLAPLPELAR